jgi:glycerol-3-phosphate dehydrogenase (NAD(P)+)
MAMRDVLLVVTPAQHLGSVLRQLPSFPQDLVLCSKGIEAGTHRLMNDVARDVAPGSQIAVLSGPTFAHEVAAGLPTAVTLACGGGDEQWQRLAPVIARPAFRPYYSDDLVGAEVGGSVKNVLAIACGVVEGRGLGLNARSALIARGFAEMTRLGVALGGRAETLAGLCGLGDLVLTCSSPQSRNMSFGMELGRGKPAGDILSQRKSVTEGVETAPAVVELARTLGVDLPICTTVLGMIEGRLDARAALDSLLNRPLKHET